MNSTERLTWGSTRTGFPALRQLETRDRRSRHGAPRRRHDHRRLPAAAPDQARDRRPRHGAARRRHDHGRVPAAAPAQARDRRSRHGAARRRHDHRRLPAAAPAQARDRRPRHGAARRRLASRPGSRRCASPSPRPPIAARCASATACITAEFPPLRQPKPEIADRGTVRLGDGLHHGRVPAAAAAQARDRRSRHGAARRRLASRPSSRRVVRNVDGHRGKRSVRDG